MSTGRHSFKYSDLTRALRAAKAAGLDVRKIEPNGTIVINNKTGETPQPNGGGERNEWDEAYGTEPTKAR
jgi:hypothetical protein